MPMGFVPLQHAPQLGHMAPQPHGLLVHGHLVGVDGGLRAGSAARRWRCSAAPPASAGVSLRRYSLTVSGERSSTWATSPSMVVRRPPMSSASFAPSTARMALKASRCLVQHGTEIFTDGLQVLLRLGDGQHVREPGQLLRGDALASVPQTAARASEGVGILGRKRPVFTLTLAGIRRRGIHGDENVHLPPGDCLLYPALHGRPRRRRTSGASSRCSPDSGC